MKEHLISNKILFLVPFLCLVGKFLAAYNVNFSINGLQYVYFFSENMILIIMNSLLVLLFYLILSKFIKSKQLLFINTILFIFAIFPGIFNKTLFCLILVFSLFYKGNNNSLNIFMEIFSAIFTIGIIVFLGINLVQTIYKGVSYLSRIKHYDGTKEIVVEENKKKPNIYWFHMDGMPSTGFIEKYYNNSLDDFHSELESMNFIDNKDASFGGAHHTMMALNSLLNPDYYDNYLKDYSNEFSKCTIKDCRTKYISDYKDLVYRRLDNELFTAMDKGGYTTVSITMFDPFTSLNTDYAYDISNYDSKCRVLYYDKKHSSKEVYDGILRVHFKNIISSYYNNKLTKDKMFDKNINCNMNLENYPNIKNGDFIQNKKIVNSLEDARSKDNNPKIYFIDNILMHMNWNYDENGKFIRDNNVDLNDYDDTYIYTTKVLLEFIKYIRENDSDSVIIIQGDHGIHVLENNVLEKYYGVKGEEILDVRNSTISTISVPEEYKNGDEDYLSNPLNISRYLINNYIGDNYEYIK